MTPEEKQAMDETFPPEVDTVYVVHTGCVQNEDGSEHALSGQVCTRISEVEANGIAQFLNEAHEGVLFLKWAASVKFPKIKGTRQDLEALVDREDVQEEWSELFGPHRKPVFRVAKLKIANEADVQALNEELKKEE